MPPLLEHNDVPPSPSYNVLFPFPSVSCRRYGQLLELLMDDGDGPLQQMSRGTDPPWQGEASPWPLGDGSKSQRSLPELPVVHTNFREGADMPINI